MNKINIVFGANTDLLDIMIDRYYDEFLDAMGVPIKYTPPKYDPFWCYIEQKFNLKIEWKYQHDNPNFGATGCTLIFNTDSDYLVFAFKELQ